MSVCVQSGRAYSREDGEGKGKADAVLWTVWVIWRDSITHSRAHVHWLRRADRVRASAGRVASLGMRKSANICWARIWGAGMFRLFLRLTYAQVQDTCFWQCLYIHFMSLYCLWYWSLTVFFFQRTHRLLKVLEFSPSFSVLGNSLKPDKHLESPLKMWFFLYLFFMSPVVRSLAENAIQRTGWLWSKCQCYDITMFQLKECFW